MAGEKKLWNFWNLQCKLMLWAAFCPFALWRRNKIHLTIKLVDFPLLKPELFSARLRCQCSHTSESPLQWKENVELLGRSYIKDIKHSHVIRLFKTLNMHPGFRSMFQRLNFWTVSRQGWQVPSPNSFNIFPAPIINLTPLAAALLCSFRWSTFT